MESYNEIRYRTWSVKKSYKDIHVITGEGCFKQYWVGGIDAEPLISFSRVNFCYFCKFE